MKICLNASYQIISALILILILAGSAENLEAQGDDMDLLIESSERARSELPQFLKKFEDRQRSQKMFWVTYWDNSDGKVSIRRFELESVDGERLAGTECYASAKLGCKFDQVLDWSNVDAYELEGAFLFKYLYSLLEGRPKFDVRDKCQFLIERIGKVHGFVEQFRWIAHGNKELVKEWAATIDPVKTFENMPMLNRSSYPHQVRAWDFNVIEYCAMMGDGEIMELFAGELERYDSNAEMSALYFAVTEPNFSTAQKLIDLGSDVNPRDFSLLEIATSLNDIEMMRFLLKHGASPNMTKVQQENDPIHPSPLFVVKTAEAAKMLVEAGTEINLKNEAGLLCTVFHRRWGRIDVLRYLVEQGAILEGGKVSDVKPGLRPILERPAPLLPRELTDTELRTIGAHFQLR